MVVAQDTKDAEEWSITAECQMIVVPRKAAFRLIAGLNDETSFDATWKNASEMIDKGEITVVADLVATGSANQKLVSESVEEVKYPTEFDPPQLPERMPQERAVEALKVWPVVAITPTAFETRNAGHTLEVEVDVSKDGSILTMDIVPQHVRFLRWVKFDAGRLPNGNTLSINQPLFHTMKNTATLRTRNGQRMLVGVHKLPEPEDAFELFVLQAKAVKVSSVK